MKVLFVTPKLGAWATHGHHLAANQMHAHWAAYAREQGTIEPEVLDCKAWDIPMDKMVHIVKEKNPDVVVVGDMLHSYGGFAVQWYFNEAAKKIKEALPHVKIVVGGLWYSYLSKESLDQNPAIDFVVMGEGEITFNELINSWVLIKTLLAQIRIPQSTYDNLYVRKCFLDFFSCFIEIPLDGKPPVRMEQIPHNHDIRVLLLDNVDHLIHRDIPCLAIQHLRFNRSLFAGVGSPLGVHLIGRHVMTVRCPRA